MAKVKVTTRFKITEFIDRFIDGHLVDSIGKAVVDGVKQSIAEGVSPVRGYGRFERYKDRESYPGKEKAHRPVNLYLTGEMLDKGYGFRLKGKKAIEVGMIKGSTKRKEIAGYHNEGTEVMAQRKFMPSDGEEFNITIMRRIRDLYGKRLTDLIKRSNKK